MVTSVKFSVALCLSLSLHLYISRYFGLFCVSIFLSLSLCVSLSIWESAQDYLVSPFVDSLVRLNNVWLADHVFAIAHAVSCQARSCSIKTHGVSFPRTSDKTGPAQTRKTPLACLRTLLRSTQFAKLDACDSIRAMSNSYAKPRLCLHSIE